MKNPLMLCRAWSESDPFAALLDTLEQHVIAAHAPEPDRPGNDDQFEWWLNDREETTP